MNEGIVTGVVFLHKNCTCGQAMKLRIRVVIYNKRIEIENVPVLICESCNHSEVFSAVKTHLVQLLGEYTESGDKVTLQFNEIDEIAGVVKKHVETGAGVDGLGHLIQERINQLLDILNLAHSLADQEWADDIRSKLTQLSDRKLLAMPQ